MTANLRTSYWANEARKAIAQAKAGLCGCGIEREKCKDHREDESK